MLETEISLDIEPFMARKPSKSNVELSNEVLTVLRQIIRATDMYSKKLSRDTSLTVPQLVVLRAIDEMGEVTMRSLSANVSLSQATVTTILDRLESRNLVERYRSTRDKRIVHAKLSSEGAQMLKNSPPLLQEEFAQTFSLLTKTRQTEIIAALQEVARMMGADEIDASPVLTVAPPVKRD